MNDRITFLAVAFLGACAVILVSATSWAAANGQPLDVSASTLAGTVLGGLAGIITTQKHQPPPPNPRISK